MPDGSFIEMIGSLGGTMSALVASFWYIKYLTDRHSEREKMWIDKDTQSDIALRELQAKSHTELLGVLSGVNTTLKDMTVAIAELKSSLERRV
jgi:hypothetical protein